VRPTQAELITLAKWRSANPTTRGPCPVIAKTHGVSPWRGQAYTTKAKRMAAEARERVQMAQRMAK
jgi:hypothetical protein